MSPLAASSLAATVVSLFSLSGCALLLGKRNLVERSSAHLTDLAAGGFLAASLFDLLPEAVHDTGHGMALVLGAAGFALFVMVNRVLPGHSHDHAPCEKHARPVKPMMVLLGDGLHNLTDGVAIAAAFAIDMRAGMVVTIATIVHEIPQELGDFGLLLSSGMGPWRAILANLASGLTAVLGAVLGSVLTGSAESAAGPLHALIAGGFIFMAWSIASHHGLRRYLLSSHLTTAGVGFALVFLASRF